VLATVIRAELLGHILGEWLVDRFKVRDFGNVQNKGQSSHFKEEYLGVLSCGAGCCGWEGLLIHRSQSLSITSTRTYPHAHQITLLLLRSVVTCSHLFWS
jgi:hypothetical protein